MSLTNRVGLLAGATTLALSGASFAETPATTNDAAMKEIAALKAELDQIKAQQGNNWLTEQRASEIRSLVQDVLSDADSRASLQSSGMTAGWDKGFFLASPDGNFKLRINGQIQFRYVMNDRNPDENNAPPGADTDHWRDGFENRRTKLIFTGNVIDKTWTYKVQGNFSRGTSVGGTSVDNSSGTFTLEDAWIQKDFDNGIYTRFGQYKAPWMREELVSSSRQLAVERSLLDQKYGQTYTQGISLGYQSDQFRAEAMYGDGIGKGANSFWGPGSQNTAWQVPTTEWAATARAEYMIAGEWKQFDDFTSWNGEPFGLMVGAAINWQRAEYGLPAVIPQSVGQQLAATADISAEFGGANLYGAFLWANSDVDSETNNGTANQFGFLVQGGVFVIPDKCELFARYEWADTDNATPENLSVLTGGVNWYFAKHASKITVDLGFTFDGFDNSFANSSAGWLNNYGSKQEYVLRAQFQLLF
ncbi:MAG: porin [Phycisphaerales bacterium]